VSARWASPSSPPPAAAEPSAADLPIAFALADLDAALAAGLDRLRPLLTAGELQVIRALQACAGPARALWARLFSRTPRPLPLDGLRYPEVGPVGLAAEALAESGVATFGPFRIEELLGLHTLPALAEVARGLGLPAKGPRAAVEASLRAHPAGRGALDRPAIALRHRSLVQRLVRAHLLGHEEGLRVLVLDRIGHRRLPEHPITPGALYPHRRALLAHEAASQRWGGPSPPPPDASLAAARGHIADRAGWAARPIPRFCALRRAIPAAAEVARGWERGGRPADALALLDELLQAAGPAGPELKAELERRAALCLAALGRPAEGARRCAQAREGAPPVAALALDRTGHRLARRSRTPWIPLPPLREPVERALTLAPAPREGPRPLWAGPEGPAEVEIAAAATVSAQGRAALRAENSPWTTLFALLLRDVLYAPVPGMLCGRGMPRPLDLGEPGFAARRADALRRALAPILAGEAPERIAAAWAAHEGEAIAGARWGACSLELLLQLGAATPGPALAGILRAMAEDWRGARAGLPDLAVLPGAAVRVPGLFPAALPAGLLLIEVKATGDSVSDAQRVWMDRLLGLGVRVEVWHVRPPGSPAALG
jgi:hypothetical protein